MTLPLTDYNYRVTILFENEAEVIGFSDVSGLSVAHEPVTYRHGMSFMLDERIIPGVQSPVRLTLTQGLLPNRSQVVDWFKTATREPLQLIKKHDMVIDLMTPTGAVGVRWTVQRALPVQLDGPTLSASNDNVATINLHVIAHGIDIEFEP